MFIITSFGWSVRVCVVSPAWTLLERPNPNPNPYLVKLGFAENDLNRINWVLCEMLLQRCSCGCPRGYLCRPLLVLYYFIQWNCGCPQVRSDTKLKERESCCFYNHHFKP